MQMTIGKYTVKLCQIVGNSYKKLSHQMRHIPTRTEMKLKSKEAALLLCQV